jgi:hypothetical protein
MSAGVARSAGKADDGLNAVERICAITARRDVLANIIG